MSFSLFRKRIVPSTALCCIRSRLHPRYGLLRAVTRQIAKQNSMPLSSLVRQFSSNTSRSEPLAFPRTRRIVKILLIGSGVWFWCLFLYNLWSDRLRIGRQRFHPLMSPMVAAIFQFDPNDLSEESSLEVVRTVMEEIQQKNLAMNLVWRKLKSEEAFLKRFGKNVNVTGYKVQFDSANDYNNNHHKSEAVTSEKWPELMEEGKESSNVRENNRDTWKVSLYIVGSESSGLVTMEFQKVNSDDKIAWIPVHLLFEAFPSSGVKLCDVSAPLPNGVTRFTRLFSDDL